MTGILFTDTLFFYLRLVHEEKFLSPGIVCVLEPVISPFSDGSQLCFLAQSHLILSFYLTWTWLIFIFILSSFLVQLRELKALAVLLTINCLSRRIKRLVERRLIVLVRRTLRSLPAKESLLRSCNTRFTVSQTLTLCCGLLCLGLTILHIACTRTLFSVSLDLSKPSVVIFTLHIRLVLDCSKLPDTCTCTILLSGVVTTPRFIPSELPCK